MSVNYRLIHTSPERVFEVLANGWLYPSWVVGASRMRDVDDAWPLEGSRLFHSFGVWPFLINDSTSVLEWDPPRHMKVRARGWPIGEAFIPEPARRVLLHARNVETLQRLAYLAEGGATAN
jgi:hypothetical protein